MCVHTWRMCSVVLRRRLRRKTTHVPGTPRMVCANLSFDACVWLHGAVCAALLRIVCMHGFFLCLPHNTAGDPHRRLCHASRNGSSHAEGPEWGVQTCWQRVRGIARVSVCVGERRRYLFEAAPTQGRPNPPASASPADLCFRAGRLEVCSLRYTHASTIPTAARPSRLKPLHGSTASAHGCQLHPSPNELTFRQRTWRMCME